MRDPRRRMEESLAFPTSVHDIADAGDSETALGHIGGHHHEAVAFSYWLPNCV